MSNAENYAHLQLFKGSNTLLETFASPVLLHKKSFYLFFLEAVGGLNNIAGAYFSGTCWYYEVQLYNKLKYPIGLVSSNVYGTPIEFWSSSDALRKCNTDKSNYDKGRLGKMILLRITLIIHSRLRSSSAYCRVALLFCII